MKKTHKILAVALCSVLAVSSLAAFAGCGSDSANSTEALVSRICYDNLPDDGISIPEASTKLTLKGITSVQEYKADGTEAEAGSVVSRNGDTLKAVGGGYVIATLKNGSVQRVDVAPAYVTDPNNEYNGRSNPTLLEGTHDPSFIEVTENGQPAYYIFSTGWNTGNEIRRSTDLIHWSLVGKATSGSTKLDDIAAWEEETNATIQWWAPDIVPAPDGGYWMYTCCVSNSHHPSSYGNVSKACIVLFHLERGIPLSQSAGKFEYVGVLMQSAIPNDDQIDVNSIDPQIIYTPDGRMYMAYGSFGMGNWMLELNPATGLRKDDIYKDNKFVSIDTVRSYEAEAESMYLDFGAQAVVSEYYGTMISLRAMEAPVIARHDNVTVSDENGKVLAKNKTYYYSMHSYNGLAAAYQMWGGRSESVTGFYYSTMGTEESGSRIQNGGIGSGRGNKYMGRFEWSDRTSNNFGIILPGHNDLFTNSVGTNLAAYITRSLELGTQSPGSTYEGGFVSQVHQYYLNSMGDIVINPNRYAGEVNRTVTEEELFHFTKDRTFKMVVFANDDAMKYSQEIRLAEGGKIECEGSEVGTWKMYGDGYIYFHFTDTRYLGDLDDSGETTFYGVVRPTWLDDQNASGFTITCMGRTPGSTNEENNCSFAMFMNNVANTENLNFRDSDGNNLFKR